MYSNLDEDQEIWTSFTENLLLSYKGVIDLRTTNKEKKALAV